MNPYLKLTLLGLCTGASIECIMNVTGFCKYLMISVIFSNRFEDPIATKLAGRRIAEEKWRLMHQEKLKSLKTQSVESNKTV